MKLPFTVEQFLAVFAHYNTTIWPLQFLVYALGITALVLIICSFRFSGRLVSLILGVFWLINGLLYHLSFFSAINKAAYLFGILFVLQGGLLILQGGIRGRLDFNIDKSLRSLLGLAFIAYAMLIYPVLGYFLGHIYPSSPVFGVAPCPTTIFTFGLLLQLVQPGEHKTLLIIPVIWSVIGFSAAFFLGIVEDTGLIIAGITSLLFVFVDNRRHSAVLS